MDVSVIEIIDHEDNAEELLPMVTPRCAPPQAITGWSDHAISQMQKRGIGADYAQSVFSAGGAAWNSTHGSWNYSDGSITVCVNASGIVNTVYWNY